MHLHRASSRFISFCVLLIGLSAHGQTNQSSLGIFEGESDVGTPTHAGSSQYDTAHGTYTLSGGGSNMWAASDSFHFVWKQMSNDFSLSADVAFVGTEGEAHRKACLLIRQSLESASLYADAALHGNGLTALQSREINGATTTEIQSLVTAPTRIRLEKRGRFISMSVAAAGESLHPAGGSFQLAMDGPFYIGLGVCAHNDKDLRQATFSNVELNVLPPATGKPTLSSTLEIIPIASKDRTALYFTTNHIEAANWSRDGTFLLFNGHGHIYRLPVTGGEPQLLDLGFATRCNNDHGISPDGTQLAISDQSEKDNKSRILLVPIGGGVPQKLTADGPSYWHGWSPDGKTIAYCGDRNGEFDVYTIPVTGGAEKRLTTAPGLDDGPEYSPDGKYIYFNSERSGSMQIWRMGPDGSNQEPVTSDEYNNWFAHLSPNGKWMVVLSYAKDVKGHPESKDVMLRLMPMAGGKITVLAKLFGGQGTINVPSWSPDSTKIAFMSYQPMP